MGIVDRNFFKWDSYVNKYQRTWQSLFFGGGAHLSRSVRRDRVRSEFECRSVVANDQMAEQRRTQDNIVAREAIEKDKYY